MQDALNAQIGFRISTSYINFMAAIKMIFTQAEEMFHIYML